MATHQRQQIKTWQQLQNMDITTKQKTFMNFSILQPSWRKRNILQF